MPGEAVKFVVEIVGSAPETAQYRWSVDKGEIVEGQGTPTLTTTYRETSEVKITATVEVFGLPKGCPNVASETFGIAICYTNPILVEEGSVASTKIDKIKLDHLVSELAKYPGAIIYIIEYFPPKTAQSRVNRKSQTITEYLSKSKGIDPNRIKVVADVMDKVLTRYYLVPPGADFPTP